jgi:hypothetical protein
LRGSGVAKRGASCGVSNMIPYRKFSDIQCGEFRTSQPPNPPKAPKVGDEEANDARTLDGLGALVGAPTADPQNQLERDAVVANDLTGENPRTESAAVKRLNLLKMDNISPLRAELSHDGQGYPARAVPTGALKTGERASTNARDFWSMTAACCALRPKSKQSSAAPSNG